MIVFLIHSYLKIYNTTLNLITKVLLSKIPKNNQYEEHTELLF